MKVFDRDVVLLHGWAQNAEINSAPCHIVSYSKDHAVNPQACEALAELLDANVIKMHIGHAQC